MMAIFALSNCCMVFPYGDVSRELVVVSVSPDAWGQPS
jgi:hypothetical protein